MFANFRENLARLFGRTSNTKTGEEKHDNSEGNTESAFRGGEGGGGERGGTGTGGRGSSSSNSTWSWSCAGCTFVNSTAKARCEVCQSAKPASASSTLEDNNAEGNTEDKHTHTMAHTHTDTKVEIKTTGKLKGVLQVALSTTVAELKQLIADRLQLPSEG